MTNPLEEIMICDEEGQWRGSCELPHRLGGETPNHGPT